MGLFTFITLIKVKNIYEFPESDEMKILNIDLKFDNPFRVSKKLNSKFIYKALNYAHKLSLNDNIAGIINCPINKTLLKRKNSGLTEFFSQKCKIIKDTEVMLITNDKFSVSPITTHLDIKDVTKKISKEIIFKKIILIFKELHIMMYR